MLPKLEFVANWRLCAHQIQSEGMEKSFDIIEVAKMHLFCAYKFLDYFKNIGALKISRE